MRTMAAGKDDKIQINLASPSRDATLPMRERIVLAASELFYAYGLRAVSAEKIIAQVGITKVTFYRHFPTKDELIVEYLQRRAKWEREAIEGAIATSPTEDEAFRLVAEGIGAESCSAGFRGCPFINAAAEYSDADHPVRQVVDSHRRWFKQAIEELLVRMDVKAPDRVADEIVMLRDGAMVSGYLSDPQTVARSLYNAGRAVIEYRA